jgi:ElaB/YqjD/DUF883 family membrane-anchored ribosome-binding protein
MNQHLSLGAGVGAFVGAIAGLLLAKKTTPTGDANEVSNSVITGVGQQLFERLPSAAHQASDAIQAGAAILASVVQQHPFEAATVAAVTLLATAYLFANVRAQTPSAPTYQSADHQV